MATEDSRAAAEVIDCPGPRIGEREQKPPGSRLMHCWAGAAAIGGD